MKIIRSLLIFKINKKKSESKKYELVYCPDRKSLLLENLVLYVYIDSEKDGKAIDIEILEKKIESPLTLSLPQLCSSIYAVENLYTVFVELLES